MQQRNTLNILLVLVAFLGLIWSCQSDTSTDSNTNSGNAASGSTSDMQMDSRLLMDSNQEAPDYAAKAQELEKQLDQYHTKLIALRNQVNAVPAAAKKNAVDYEDLEARLDGYLEKGSYLQEETKQVLSGLAGEGTTLTGRGDAADSGPDYGSILQEQENGLAKLNEALAILEQAVEKLKSAKGGNVVLFGEQ